MVSTHLLIHWNLGAARYKARSSVSEQTHVMGTKHLLLPSAVLHPTAWPVMDGSREPWGRQEAPSHSSGSQELLQPLLFSAKGFSVWALRYLAPGDLWRWANGCSRARLSHTAGVRAHMVHFLLKLPISLISSFWVENSVLKLFQISKRCSVVNPVGAKELTPFSYCGQGTWEMLQWWGLISL